MVYFIDKTNRSYSRSNNRAYDYRELEREAKTNPDPGARKLAEQAMRDIRLEEKPMKDMREVLIKAHRSGDQDKVKDIHDIVAHKRKYRNE